ncbi:MAG TPA: pantetheine-phosphate adenylyltransferase [Epulopiscium sp.]|nr:pantetheine-phosphate adenylyltransferase [Candidatus Epulonipiscium sp.]
MKVGIYPGSFDPVTNGHIDIIRRSAKLVDTLVVAILQNTNKNSLFSEEERIKLLYDSCTDIENLQIECFSGLLVDFAKAKKADLIIRGLRALTDFEYEFQMAQMNKHLYPDVETIFLVTDVKYSFLSSSAIKEVAKFGGSVSDFVPQIVADQTLDKYKGGQ